MTDVINAILVGLEISLAIYGACVAISKLTPTQKDDKAVEKVRKIFEWIANVIPNLKVTKTGIKTTK